MVTLLFYHKLEPVYKLGFIVRPETRDGSVIISWTQTVSVHAARGKIKEHDFAIQTIYYLFKTQRDDGTEEQHLLGPPLPAAAACSVR